MNKHITAISFFAVQVIGLTCTLLWQHVPSSMGMAMWGTSTYLALPRKLPRQFRGCRAIVLEKPCSTVGLDLLTIVAVVAANAILWFVVVKACQSIFHRSSKISA